MTPQLEILSGDLSGRCYAMDEDEFLIGRAPTCDLVIPKKYISRQHARIVREGRDWVIDGLSEKNPVKVDRRPIREHLLNDGDEFEVCGIRIRFRIPTNGGPSRGRKAGRASGMGRQGRPSEVGRHGGRRSGLGHGGAAAIAGISDLGPSQKSRKPRDPREDSWRDADVPSRTSRPARDEPEDSWQDAPAPRQSARDAREDSWRDADVPSRTSRPARDEPEDSWQDAPAPPPDEDSWQDAPPRQSARDAGEDSWAADAPDEDSWQPARDPAEDSWQTEDRGEDDSWAAPTSSRRSREGQVVFGDGGEQSEGDKTGEIPIEKLSTLSSRGSGSGIRDESSNERTAELGKALDPDDPDYDPFAQVEDSKKKVREVDPHREKMLRIVSVVGLIGIALAIVVQQRLKVTGPPKEIRVEEPITLKVGQIILFEETWTPNNPPYSPAMLRRDGQPEESDFLIKDAVAEVEWIVPHISRRSLFLIRGLEEGDTEFAIRFPKSNRVKYWRIVVEGSNPHDLARDKRREKLKKKPPRELRDEVQRRLARGETLNKERNSPGKEAFYRRAHMEFMAATDAAEAWRTILAKQGRASKQVVEMVRRCEDAEAKALDEWQKFLEREIGLYEAMVNRGEAPEDCVTQLKRVMRGIAHSCDVRYKRYSVLLAEAWQDSMNERFKCEHDADR